MVEEEDEKAIMWPDALYKVYFIDIILFVLSFFSPVC